MTIITGFSVLFQLLKQMLALLFAWIPQPFANVVFLLLGLSMVLLIIHLAMILKELIFNWL